MYKLEISRKNELITKCDNLLLQGATVVLQNIYIYHLLPLLRTQLNQARVLH